MDNLYVKNLSCGYGANNVIRDISFTVEAGEFVGIIGPNVSGKSTVLKNIYGVLTPRTGQILLDDMDIKQFSCNQLARLLAVVGQENEIPFSFTVEEIVKMGRHPHKRLFAPDTLVDKHIVDAAIDKVGLSALAKRDYSSLSGGEKQRALIARAIAQSTELLILDEPTNHLDICFQLQIFELVKALGKTVLAAIHDLNLAAMYCDKVIVLNHGQVAKIGSPREILSSELIYDIFGVQSTVNINNLTGTINVTYMRECG